MNKFQIVLDRIMLFLIIISVPLIVITYNLFTKYNGFLIIILLITWGVNRIIMDIRNVKDKDEDDFFNKIL